MVYDVTNGESFVNVKRWLQEIDQNCDVVNRILGMSKCTIAVSTFHCTIYCIVHMYIL